MPETIPLSASDLELIETIAEITQAEATYFQAAYDELLAREITG